MDSFAFDLQHYRSLAKSFNSKNGGYREEVEKM
jgi:hypothetical protein